MKRKISAVLLFCLLVLFGCGQQASDSTHSETISEVTSEAPDVEDATIALTPLPTATPSLIPTETTALTEAPTTSESLVTDSEDVKLDELQLLFINLPAFADRNDINDYIKENGFYSHRFTGDKEYYIGLTPAAVNSRPRDREGAVIEVIYDNNGILDKAGYTTGGSVGFFGNFELTYENAQFNYRDKSYSDGEEAMKLYLVNVD